MTRIWSLFSALRWDEMLGRILQQACISVLAQANQPTQSVLSLLRYKCPHQPIADGGGNQRLYKYRRNMIYFLRNLTAFFFAEYIASSLIYNANKSFLMLNFYDLSLPLISTLLVLYKLKAVPVLAIYYVCCYFYHPETSLLTLSAQLPAALISQMIYFFFTEKKGMVSFGRSKLTGHRIAWLVLFNSSLFMIFNHFLECLFASKSIFDFFNIQTLINFQWVLNSCLTGIPFCYVIFRAIYKPFWFLTYCSRLKKEISEGASFLHQVLWFLIVSAILYCLMAMKHDSLIFTDYSLLWLLPVMLWGIMCIGYTAISHLWVIILILLSYYIDDYIQQTTFSSYLHSLAISSTMLFVFSLTIVVAGVLTKKNRDYLRFLNRLIRIEYNTGLPNFQALRMDIKKTQTKCICHVRHPELNVLEKIHGFEFRFEFIRALSLYIRGLIKEGDDIYYSPVHGIIIRLNSTPSIANLYLLLNDFRFEWKGYKLGLFCGLSYTAKGDLSGCLSNVIRNLYTYSYDSLQQGKVICVDFNAPGDNIVNQATIRHYLQDAIDKQSFFLMAQPIAAVMPIAQSIISMRSVTNYHEVLVRIKTNDGKMIFPDTILPIAQDAGLLPALDFTVIEQTFRFMKSRTDCNFSINITPESLNNLNFPERLIKLLNKYEVTPGRITFEVIESDIIDNFHVANVLALLRDIGIKVAIDDFGTGSSSYSRLRSLEADLLKIDGSFIRNILSDDFDFCAVKSFCEIAKLKNMEIVAEFVENEQIEKILTGMGVDWLQGYHIGKPIPIDCVSLTETL